jgi:CRP-like cAMP-binding protein
MSDPQQALIRNQLLSAMPREDFAALQPHLEPVPLELRQVLYEPHQPIEQVYFPESGYTSIVTNGGGNQVELGIIGREGMVGVPVVLGARCTPFQFFIQNAGNALRMTAFCLERHDR